jgi:ABC-type nitrate/sulfonate/bicarbonate transport system ATPase subunit
MNAPGASRVANVKLSGVIKHFTNPAGSPVRVLDRIDLEIEAGSFLCLLGPSGCGKTTLLNMVAGFDRPDRGTVSVGKDFVTAPGPDRGVVFQDYAIYPWLSVEQNISFGPRVRGVPAEAIRDITQRYLGLMGLEAFASYLPQQLSGGMRQRVAIARVLANEPRVLLMDEPFAALDAQTRYILQRELVRVWLREKLTVLFVTHNIEEALLLGDRVVLMSRRPGRVQQDMRIELSRPRDVSDARFNELRRELLDMLDREIGSKLEQERQGESL